MAIKNFNACVVVDGKGAKNIGPLSKDGGLSIVLAQRESGYISEKIIRIYCFAKSDGTLLTQIYDSGVLILEQETKR